MQKEFQRLIDTLTCGSLWMDSARAIKKEGVPTPSLVVKKNYFDITFLTYL